MNDMTAYLAQRIRTMGPMTVADFMSDALMHPKFGYYQKQRVFGKDGDFITAPEVSQMFGEVIGLWLAERWQAMGSPPKVNLIELGPGRGTLMSDIMHTIRGVKGFKKAITVHLVEQSAQLRALQKTCAFEAMWHDTLAEVPSGPSLLVANEFFDALPIHQFEKKDGLWFERAITLGLDDKLSITLVKPSAKFAMVPEQLRSAKNGDIVEICPVAISIMAEISERIKTDGGAALIIDYGYDKAAVGDTFQALKDHLYCNPLEAVGLADLTAHVNFESLIAVANEASLKTYGPKGQGDFLMQIGMATRAGQLANGKSKPQQIDILNALIRLTDPKEMGQLFRVIAVTDKGQSPANGFEMGAIP